MLFLTRYKCYWYAIPRFRTEQISRVIVLLSYILFTTM